MMYQKLKSEIKEIIKIVNDCPETVQEKCFEVLLNNYLKIEMPTKDPGDTNTFKTQFISNHTPTVEADIEPKNAALDEEIEMKDFHVKTKRFLETNSITIDIINALYYKENGKLMPLYETLKSTKMAECQIRLSLLTAFENSFLNANGEMTFNGEIVRKRCQDMKCYDGANFATNYKKSSNLLDNWNEKYVKTVEYSLSTEAKKELAQILLDLSNGE